MAGILETLFAPRKEEELNPLTIGEAQGVGTKLAGQGVAQGIGALAGRDVRPKDQIRTDAIERVKTKIAASNAPVGSDEFYKATMMALQQEGFPAEALAASKAWQEQKNQNLDREIKQGELNRKSNKDVMEAEIARAKIERMGGESQNLISFLEHNAARMATLADDDPSRAALSDSAERAVARLKALAAAKNIQVLNRGDKLELIDSDGSMMREVSVGAKPGTPKVAPPSPLEAATQRGEAKSGEAAFQAAQKAPAAIEKIAKSDALLRQGNIITGFGADLRLEGERFMNLVTSKKFKDINEAVRDTDLTNALLGSDVFGYIQSLGIGARGLDTPAEREFLRQVMTGTLKMTPETLLRMNQIRRDAMENAIQHWNTSIQPGGSNARFIAARGLSPEQGAVTIPPRAVEKQPPAPAAAKPVPAAGGWGIRKK